MKKKAVAWILLLALCLTASAAMAKEYGKAVVCPPSGKLHLRTGPSSNYESMGLFFTGAPVTLLSKAHGGWVEVRVGVHEGYMYADYLRSGSAGDRVRPDFWSGTVTAKNYCNYRRGPSTEYQIFGRLYNGDPVTIMGETSEGWYFIRTSKRDGYVSKSLVRLTYSGGNVQQSSSTNNYWNNNKTDNYWNNNSANNYWNNSGWEEEEIEYEEEWGVQFPDESLTIPTYSDELPAGMPTGWVHMSGAGAWSTELYLLEDGAFYGRFHDSDANVVYESTFSGTLSGVRRFDAFRYEMTVESLHIDGTLGQATAKDGMLYITQAPAGVEQGDTLRLYLPGTPLAAISEDKLAWLYQDSGAVLADYFLCSESSGRGFMPDDE